MLYYWWHCLGFWFVLRLTRKPGGLGLNCFLKRHSKLSSQIHVSWQYIASNCQSKHEMLIMSSWNLLIFALDALHKKLCFPNSFTVNERILPKPYSKVQYWPHFIVLHHTHSTSHKIFPYIIKSQLGLLFIDTATDTSRSVTIFLWNKVLYDSY